VGALKSGSPSALAWTIVAVVGYLGFFYVSAAAPSHWREVRSEADLEEKHMFRVRGNLRLGAGDTLCVLVLVSAIAGQLLWVVVAVAAVAPLAIALKLRRVLTQRPWEERPGVTGEAPSEAASPSDPAAQPTTRVGPLVATPADQISR